MPASTIFFSTLESLVKFPIDGCLCYSHVAEAQSFCVPAHVALPPKILPSRMGPGTDCRDRRLRGCSSLELVALDSCYAGFLFPLLGWVFPHDKCCFHCLETLLTFIIAGVGPRSGDSSKECISLQCHFLAVLDNSSNSPHLQSGLFFFFFFLSQGINISTADS